jgi:indolepyruvate ferredoxin oxidoreductase
MGDAIGGNLFLLGYAYQKGLIPVSADAINRSIELNGVAIEFNKQAFTWGRRSAHDEESVKALLPQQKAPFKPLQALNEIVDYRVNYLTQYQDAAYAARYQKLVDDSNAKVSGLDKDERLIKAIAKNYFKLMAIKDEYEVARLYTDGKFAERIKQQFEGGYEMHFHLAPPLFAKKDPETGKQIKKEYGPWMMRAFALLAKGKRLRGSAWDVFSYTEERKMEVALIGEFEDLVEKEILPNLTAENLSVAVDLISSVEKIRGFGHVKDAAVTQWRQKRSELLDKFYGCETSAVHFVDLDQVV